MQYNTIATSGVHYMVFAPYIALGSVAPVLVSKQLGICVSLKPDQNASWFTWYMYANTNCIAMHTLTA